MLWDLQHIQAWYRILQYSTEALNPVHDLSHILLFVFCNCSLIIIDWIWCYWKVAQSYWWSGHMHLGCYAPAFRGGWQSSPNIRVIRGDSCNFDPIPWLLPNTISDHWLKWLSWSTVGIWFMATLFCSPAWKACPCLPVQLCSYSTHILISIVIIDSTQHQLHNPVYVVPW